jgi:hypothetical protein
MLACDLRLVSEVCSSCIARTFLVFYSRTHVIKWHIAGKQLAGYIASKYLTPTVCMKVVVAELPRK